MTTRVACVIPALDAALTLPAVVAGVRAALPGVSVIVVSDGSSDGTPEVARGVSDEVIVFPANRGKGAALRAGIARALDGGFDVVATIDADGQHDPRTLPDLVAALSAADVVIGRRARGGTEMPVQRRVSNWLASGVVSLLARTTIEDSQSGLRVFRAEVFRRITPRGERYAWESSVLIEAGRAGFRIAERPVPTTYGGPSHFRGIEDTLLLMETMLKAGLR
ncbi:MAG: hypothetical protein JWO05_2741 [Gemmatimonadetes bacterium]|nr:hypothetical protein [Gemmatimonadota bacterium]